MKGPVQFQPTNTYIINWKAVNPRTMWIDFCIEFTKCIKDMQGICISGTHPRILKHSKMTLRIEKQTPSYESSR